MSTVDTTPMYFLLRIHSLSYHLSSHHTHTTSFSFLGNRETSINLEIIHSRNDLFIAYVMFHFFSAYNMQSSMDCTIEGSFFNISLFFNFSVVLEKTKNISFTYFIYHSNLFFFHRCRQHIYLFTILRFVAIE